MNKNTKATKTQEKTLIEQLVKGEQSAFQFVVSEYHSTMLSVAKAIVGEAFADEVVQEAWVSAIRALPKFEARSSLKTWLLQIVSNGAKSRLRKESRKLSLDDGWESEPSDKFDSHGHRLDNVMPWNIDTPEALVANQQLRKLIENSFQSLPATQRAVLSMYDLDNISVPEICNILDLTESNVRVLLHRARTTIHHEIRKYQEN